MKSKKRSQKRQEVQGGVQFLLDDVHDLWGKSATDASFSFHLLRGPKGFFRWLQTDRL